MTGRRLKHYQVEARLGSGGMGEVYKARDTKLDRTVAIKVLSPEYLSQESRRQRFYHEARAASALNHPNIVTIHEIDSEDGVDFIVMEYVSGQSLDALIPRGGMPIVQALRIAGQVAEGLRRAHSAGIVHRDLKPSNVMVSEEGQVKLLDFGLAKQTGDSGLRQDEATRTARDETAEGTVMGTVSYMSPEQAEGRKLDARTDIFSFGAVLYEMLAGQKAFSGDSKISTMSAILKEEPKTLANISADLEKTIQRCLRKDREKRYQHMDDVKIALDELREESESGKNVVAVTPRKVNRKAPILVGVAVLLAGGAALSWRILTGDVSAPTSPIRVSRLTRDAGLNDHPAVSPDGRLVAYSSDRAGEGHKDIWVQQLAGGSPLRLTKDREDEDYPTFSPDGTQIVYTSTEGDGAIYSVATLGGDPRLLTRTPRPLNTQYSPDGKWIAFDPQGWTGSLSNIHLLSVSGGAPSVLKTSFTHTYLASWSPDGQHLLIGSPGVPGLHLVETAGGTPKTVPIVETLKQHGLRMAGIPRWGNDGLVLQAASGEQLSLYRVSFDSDSQRLGKPELLVSATGTRLLPSLGPNGPLVYSAISTRTSIYSIPLDINKGKITGKVEALTNDDADNVSATLSDDGSRMAFVSRRSGKPQLWWRDMNSGKDTLVGTEPVVRGNISPDGTKVAYELLPGESGIGLVDLSTSASKRICDKCSVQKWMPDSSHVMYYVRDPDLRYLLYNPSTGKETVFLPRAIRGVNWIRFSNDMKWVSFHTIQNGRTRIHVAPYSGGEFPGEATWIPITEETDGHHYSSWSPDGTMLYFLSGRMPESSLLAQPLDPLTKKPRGKKFEVFRAPSGHTFVHVRFIGLSLAPGRMVLSMSETKGNLWMVER